MYLLCAATTMTKSLTTGSVCLWELHCLSTGGVLLKMFELCFFVFFIQLVNSSRFM